MNEWMNEITFCPSKFVCPLIYPADNQCIHSTDAKVIKEQEVFVLANDAA